MKLTAVIICRSKRKKELKRALKSVKFADEVVVHRERKEIDDFSAVRNRLLGKAKGNWVLFLDSDEEISPKLAREINDQIIKLSNSRTNLAGFYLRRKDRFLGRWLRHGETSAVRLMRLARKDGGKWERPVHEVWRVKGRTGELKSPILHYSHESADEMMGKLDRYSEMEEGYRFHKTNKKTNKSSNKKIIKIRLLVEMALYPTGKFAQNYFLRWGVLDGRPGFIHALLMSGHSFLVRAKILARTMRSNE